MDKSGSAGGFDRIMIQDSRTLSVGLSQAGLNRMIPDSSLGSVVIRFLQSPDVRNKIKGSSPSNKNPSLTQRKDVRSRALESEGPAQQHLQRMVVM